MLSTQGESMSQASYQVVMGSWAQLQQDAIMIREQVFVQEQNIDPKDEWDELDAVSLHVVVYTAGQAIATARLLANDWVGRVAVLKNYRGLGIGQLVMQNIIAQAQREQRGGLYLSAQEHALDFYARLGFQQQGESYLDCNIPHITMHLAL